MKMLTESEIKQFLEFAPLYAWREYKKPIAFEYLHIREIDGMCGTCGRTRPFQHSGLGSGCSSVKMRVGTDLSDLEFTCVSCDTDKRIYHVELIVNEDTIQIQKYGELPRMKLQRDRILQRFLKNDLENYEKAVICLSHEYGIAAFAYFRRLVENNIDRLLELLREDFQSSGVPTEVMGRLSNLRKNSPMSEKIEIANHALPQYLQPAGLNPLRRLYQVLSEGVHEFSEEECLNKAKAISDCLTYLVSELASRKRHRIRFQKSAGAL